MLFEFREGHRTVTTLAILKQIVRDVLTRNKYCTIMSLDIGGPFDIKVYLTQYVAYFSRTHWWFAYTNLFEINAEELYV